MEYITALFGPTSGSNESKEVSNKLSNKEGKDTSTSILSDSGLEKIASLLNTQTYYSHEVCENLLSKGSIFPKANEIAFYQNTITKLRNMEDKEKMNEHIKDFVACEKRCAFFFEEKNSLESLEEDTFGQLIFQHHALKIFNHIPFFVMLVSYMKIYFVPIVSVVLPFLMYFLPYLLVKYVWKLPISFEMYQEIMGKMWSFSMDMSPDKILQNLLTVFTLGQSMYQPIQNAFHLHTIHKNIHGLGTAIYDLMNSVEKIQALLKKSGISFHISKLTLPEKDAHRAFIEILEQPSRLLAVSKDIAKLDILWAISQNVDFEKVTFYASEKPFFKGTNIVDMNLEKGAKGSTINILENNNHFLLSGPNGGGKSSFLRGLLQTVVLSQAFGYSIAKNVEMSPFDFILSGLHIVDNPGKQSLFEKEIIFARDVLYHNNPKYKGFVVFDEIFHSTNPPDGIRTSQLFLQKLWSYSHMCSIVSTHVFEIIETAPAQIQKICVKAVRTESGMKYDYCISEGICKESSVDEIWKKEW